MHRIAPLFVFVFMVGCGWPQYATRPMVEAQTSVSAGVPIRPVVFDERSDGFKSSYHYSPKTALASTFGAGTAIGDKLLDRPLGDVFADMVSARFGKHADGFWVELRLKEFAAYWRRNPAANLPFISFFFITSDVTWDGVLDVDVVALGSDGKFALQRSYRYVHTVKKPYNTENEEACRFMLQEVFSFFAQDFERDLGRTRF